jgi:hypothetical protein
MVPPPQTSVNGYVWLVIGLSVQNMARGNPNISAAMAGFSVYNDGA